MIEGGCDKSCSFAEIEQHLVLGDSAFELGLRG